MEIAQAGPGRAPGRRAPAEEREISTPRLALKYLQDDSAVLGLEFVPSYANLFWLKVGDRERAVFQALLRQGINRPPPRPT